MYKITYIIPVYNTKPYLIERCLKSIKLDNSNIKAIIVDDASTNKETIAYLEQLDKSNIILLKNNINLGAGASRIVAVKYMIDNLDNDFFAFVDSDDYISFDSQVRLVEQMIKNNVNIGIGRIRCKSAHSFMFLKSRKFKNQVINLSEEPKALRIGPSTLSNKIYNIALAHYFLKETAAKAYEDMEIMFYILAKANKILVSNEIIYNYEMSVNGLFLSQMNPLNSNGLKQTTISSDERDKKFISDGLYEQYKETLNSIRYAFLMQRICSILKSTKIKNKKELVSVILSMVAVSIPNFEKEKSKYGFKYRELNDILFILFAQLYLKLNKLNLNKNIEKEELYDKYEKILKR